MPADGSVTSLTYSGYDLAEFYSDLGGLKASHIFVFIDSCFSGMQARPAASKLTSLIDARPAMLVTPEPVVPSNVAGMASSGVHELSNAYREKAHGLFTYFLLKGMSELQGSSVPLSVSPCSNTMFQKTSIDRQDHGTPCHAHRWPRRTSRHAGSSHA